MTRTETGSLSLWMAILATGLFATVALVASGGEALAAKARAESQAFTAARAGAEQISASSLATGAPTLDPAGAHHAAEQALAADNAAGTILVSDRTVAVAVTAQVPGGLLSLVGIRTLEVTGTAQATATPGP